MSQNQLKSADFALAEDIRVLLKEAPSDKRDMAVALIIEQALRQSGLTETAKYFNKWILE